MLNTTGKKLKSDSGANITGPGAGAHDLTVCTAVQRGAETALLANLLPDQLFQFSVLRAGIFKTLHMDTVAIGP